jgi:ABC-2 type transport system ATP-binding protein
VDAIRAERLTKEYKGRPVLDEVDLTIGEGERFCLLGRNGSGKSTFLEIVMGMKVATRGKVEVLGRDPLDVRLKRQCAVLMDRAVFPYYARVCEVVWLYAGFYDDPLDGAELMAAFELDPSAYVRHLSKGQNQRLGMLLTVLGNPRLILLDEPTSGLDPQGRLLLWTTLGRSLAGDGPRTLVFATHNLVEAERWGTRVGILHQGRLVATASPDDLCREVIGTRRKLTVVGVPREHLEFRVTQAPVSAVSSLGAEVALYTDDPEAILARLDLADPAVEIRIENVTLRDVYFRLTGEVPDGPAQAAA